MTRARMRLRWRGYGLYFGSARVGYISDEFAKNGYYDAWSEAPRGSLIAPGLRRTAAKRAVRAFVVREMRAAVRGSK